MIRELLPDMTDEEFREVMEITTDDIRENRTKFGKETDLEEMLAIAKRSLKVLRQCNMAVNFYFDGYTAHEAVRKAKYDLDDDEIYDMETGQTICTIDVATDKQTKDLLR